MAGDAGGLTLDVRIDMFPTESGGLRLAIRTGYRPLLIVRTADVEPTMIGLCELTSDHPIEPGTVGYGQLEFAPAVSEPAGRLLPLGSRFNLAEGPHIFAEAEVLGTGP